MASFLFLKEDRSPFNTSPPQISLAPKGAGREICKDAFFVLVDRLPATKKTPATCLNLRFNQVGLQSRLRNLWFRTSRRTCRRQRLKPGALRPQTPGKSAREPFSIISNFAVRWSLIPNGTRRAGTNHRKMAALPQSGQSAVFPDL